jgi:hypothetical protein
LPWSSPKTHWKDAIDAHVDPDRLAYTGLSLADVREAVIHFTGTVPTVRETATGYHVRAVGYRNGPCGDR